MVSSWKAAETGIVQVPRSCDGSVRAARPLAIFSLGDLETLRSRRAVPIDPDQRPFLPYEARGKEARSMRGLN
jgi:hypothetical protein